MAAAGEQWGQGRTVREPGAVTRALNLSTEPGQDRVWVSALGHVISSKSLTFPVPQPLNLSRTNVSLPSRGAVE